MNFKLAQRYHDDGMAVTPRPQLVVKLYERLLLDLEQATRAVTDGRIETVHVALVHAQDIVYELSLALDVDQWEGGRGLQSIYDHLATKLIDANLRKSSALVDECIEVVRPLVEAWQQALVITQTDRGATPPSAERVPLGSVTA